jgi:hypothetical protein
MGHALVKAALAKIPVVQLGIVREVRPDIGLAARTIAEVLVDTLLAIDPVIYFRHGALEKPLFAVIAGRHPLLKTIPAEKLPRVLKEPGLRFLFAAVCANFLQRHSRFLRHLNMGRHVKPPPFE